MVAVPESLAEPRYASALLPLDLLGRLVDALLEQARRGGGSSCGALDLDLLYDCAAVMVGGYDRCDASLRSN